MKTSDRLILLLKKIKWVNFLLKNELINVLLIGHSIPG